MADLTAHKEHKTRPRAGRDAFPIANGVTLYAGALVGLESGYLNHWADGANDVFLGMMQGGYDRAGDGVLTGATADTPDPEGYVDTSGVILRKLASVGDTPAQAKVGDLVYCNTSNTDDMTLNSSGMTHPIGWVVRYRSATDIDVQLFTPAEMLAQATA